MGGDEFVIVLTDYPPEALQNKINLLAEAARTAGRDVLGEDLLSLSVGEASFPVDGADAEKLLAEADRRMYKSKQEHKALKATTSVWNLTRVENSTLEPATDNTAALPAAASSGPAR